MAASACGRWPDGVAHGLDHDAAVVGNRLPDDVEVGQNDAEGGSIPHPSVKLCCPVEVGEGNGERSHGDALSRAQGFTGEEIAKILQGDDFGGGDGLVAEGLACDDEQLLRRVC